MSAAAAVKTAASLLGSGSAAQPGVEAVVGAGGGLLLLELQTAVPQGREWHEQQRQQQRDEPSGGASTSQAAPGRNRERVTFGAACSSSAPEIEAGTLEPADAAHGSQPQQQQQQHRWQPHQHPDEGEQQAARGLTGRLRKTAFEEGTEGNASSSSGRRQAATGHGVGSIRFQEPADDGPGLKSGHTTDRSHASAAAAVASSGFSASLKGLFGGASVRLLGSLIGRVSNSSSRSNDGDEEAEELWFTSLDDFKPICHMLHRGRYMTAYFACAHKTGQHFLLKKFDKHKMLPAEERGVRRSIAFSELLHHPNLVKCRGQWEADDTIFVVEEYVGKGDVFNDAISHPDKYTERHVALALVKPLLRALAHLHANNIIHRSVLPENVYMGIDDVLRLGHLTLAVDQLSDRPKSRTALLDYMSPEMLSVKLHNEHELSLLEDDQNDDDYDSRGGDSDRASSSSSGNGWRAAAAQPQQQQQQQQQPGRRAELPPPAAAATGTPGKQQQQQQQYSSSSGGGGNQVQQPAQLDSSCLPSPDAEASEAAVSASSSRRWRSGRAAAGKAPWEDVDQYDEKVDIWQLGCLVHELLCGSMPFEVDSKLESAGLALWADIQQPPGGLAPDCTAFVQAALTKDPRARPSAEALLSHPWLARCEAGQPWRDQAELEAARLAAELATAWGWLRHRGRQAAAALRGLRWQRHGARVQPAAADGEAAGASQQQQQGQEDQGEEGERAGAAVSREQGGGRVVSFSAGTRGGWSSSEAAAGCLKPAVAGASQQLQQAALQQLPSRQQSQQLTGGSFGASKAVPPLQLTAEVLGALDRGWAAADGSSGFNAACVVTAASAAAGSVSPAKQAGAAAAGSSFAMPRALAAAGDGAW